MAVTGRRKTLMAVATDLLESSSPEHPPSPIAARLSSPPAYNGSVAPVTLAISSSLDSPHPTPPRNFNIERSATTDCFDQDDSSSSSSSSRVSLSPDSHSYQQRERDRDRSRIKKSTSISSGDPSLKELSKKKSTGVWSTFGDTFANRSSGSLLSRKGGSRLGGGESKKESLTKRDDLYKSCLHHAVFSGDLLRCQSILRLPKAPQKVLNSQDINGWTPLHYALCYNQASIARFLLSQPAIDVRVPNLDGSYPIHYLARNSMLPEASALFDMILQRGGSAYSRTANSGEYPFHLACWSGQLNLLQKISKQQTSQNLQNFRGETVLHYAALSASAELFQTLLAAGADPWIADYRGNLPIDLIQDRSPGNPIFAAAAKVYGPIAAGSKEQVSEEYPLHHAAHFGQLDRLKALVAASPEALHDIDTAGNTPLLYAAYHRRFEAIRLLLAVEGSHVGIPNAWAATILHVVCLTKPIGSYEGALVNEIIKLVVSHAGLQPSELLHQTNKLKETPLHCAIAAGNAKAVSDLISLGASIAAINHSGYSCLDYAIICPDKKIAEFLIANKAHVTIATVDIATRTAQTHLIERVTGGARITNHKATSTRTGKMLIRTSSVLAKTTAEIRSLSSSRSNFQHGRHDFMLATTNPADDFFMQDLLGTGAHAEVYQAKHKKTGDVVAIKKILVTEEDARELIKTEISVLEGCNHENIVRYHGCFFQGEEIWIIMDFCAVGSLLDIRRNFMKEGLTEDQLAAILHRILLGLAYLHKIGTIHRDMKSGNVLINNDAEVKIADFGVSCQFNPHAKVHTTIGTPLFMSPEVINGAPYDSKADMWSLGITAIEMTDGVPPRFNEHILRAMLMISREEPPTLANPASYSPEFNDFISRCLQKDPSQRPTAELLLEHPFITRTTLAQQHKTLTALVQKIMASKKQHKQVSEQEERERSLLPAIDAYLTSLSGRVFPTSAALQAATSDLERFRQNLNSLSERIAQGREGAISAEQVEELAQRLTVAQKALKQEAKQSKKIKRQSSRALPLQASKSMDTSPVPRPIPTSSSFTSRGHTSSKLPLPSPAAPSSSQSTPTPPPTLEGLQLQIQQLMERQAALEADNHALRLIVANHLAACGKKRSHHRGD